jgi:hypothetical protein
MKTQTLLLVAIAALFASPAARADSDSLVSKTITFTSADPDAALDALAASPGSIFRNWKLDPPQGGMKITKPLHVSGSDQQPVVTMSVCQASDDGCAAMTNSQMVGVVDFQAAQKTAASCDKQYLMKLDLSRSDMAIANTYNGLNVTICYKKNAAGNGGTLGFVTKAQQAGGYWLSSKTGVAELIKGFLNQQIPSITQAVKGTLQSGPKAKRAQLRRPEEEREQTAQVETAPAA